MLLRLFALHHGSNWRGVSVVMCLVANGPEQGFVLDPDGIKFRACEGWPGRVNYSCLLTFDMVLSLDH
jgi:hypothetical protein